VVFDLANRLAVVVGEDRGADHSLMLVRVVGGRALLGNIHMDSHPLAKVEMDICCSVDHFVEGDVVTEPRWPPAPETKQREPQGEDTSDLFHKSQARQLCQAISSLDSQDAASVWSTQGVPAKSIHDNKICNPVLDLKGA